jgi:hypothetical protein
MFLSLGPSAVGRGQLLGVGRLWRVIGPDRSKKLERFLPTSDRLSRKRGVVSAWARGLRRLEQLRRDEKRRAGRLSEFFDPVSGVDRIADDCEF